MNLFEVQGSKFESGLAQSSNPNNEGGPHYVPFYSSKLFVPKSSWRNETNKSQCLCNPELIYNYRKWPEIQIFFDKYGSVGGGPCDDDGHHHHSPPPPRSTQHYKQSLQAHTSLSNIYVSEKFDMKCDFSSFLVLLYGL